MRIITVSTSTSNGIFFPFILSVDGMIGREDLVIVANLSGLMAEKNYQPILHVRGWINGLIAIVVARSYSRMIRVACSPRHLQDRELEWYTGLGLGCAHPLKNISSA